MKVFLDHGYPNLKFDNSFFVLGMIKLMGNLCEPNEGKVKGFFVGLMSFEHFISLITELKTRTLQRYIILYFDRIECDEEIAYNELVKHF